MSSSHSVPWVDMLPKHWDVRPGLAVLSEKQEKNTGMRESQVLSLSYGKVVVKDQDKLYGLVPDSFETYQIVEPGDIIVRPTDLQNDQTSLRVGISRDRGIITAAYLCLRAGKLLLSEYAYLLLHAYDVMKIYYGMGSGLRQNLSFADFKRLPIIIPPKDEQLAIVRFLDNADRRIGRYIRAKKKLIALINEQKQAIIHRALTRGLDPDVNLRPSEVPWLGDLPKHWEIRRAKALCTAIIDCRNRTPDAVDNGEYLVVRTTCIRDGEFDPAGGYTTDELNYRAWTARGAPQSGDVFFTREAPAGEACLVPARADLCMGQRVMYFRPNPELLDSRFLLLNIYGPLTKPHIEVTTNGSTVGHLRLGQVYALPLIWCPIEEQRAIVAHVASATADLDAAADVAKAEIALLQQFRSRLVADVVTGNLDVREAAARLPEQPETDVSGDGEEALLEEVAKSNAIDVLEDVGT